MRTVKWSDIQVGDLVLVEKNSRIPADLLMLTSSEPKGAAFIETSTLDGEKHLKPRESLASIRSNIKVTECDQEAHNSKKKGVYGVDMNLYFDLNIQHPNPSLYNFEGYIQHHHKADPSTEGTQTHNAFAHKPLASPAMPRRDQLPPINAPGKQDKEVTFSKKENFASPSFGKLKFETFKASPRFPSANVSKRNLPVDKPESETPMNKYCPKPETGKKESLESKHFLFKGAKIKNTDWVLGLVLYTGTDTKI